MLVSQAGPSPFLCATGWLPEPSVRRMTTYLADERGMVRANAWGLAEINS